MEKVESIYNVKIIEEIFQVGPAKAIRMMESDLMGFKIGKEWRCLKKDVEAYIKRQIAERGN
ncbi:MAG: hypothetical protein ACI9IA_000206 [Enterobacterales bacterium]